MNPSRLFARLVILLAAAARLAAASPDTPPFTLIHWENPRGIAVDLAGDLYVSDTASASVHQLTTTGSDRPLSTVMIQSPFGLAVDRSGNLYISDDHASAIYRRAGDGKVVILAQPQGALALDDATTLVVDGTGTVFVGDNHHSVIRKITPDGTVSTFAGAFGEKGNQDGQGGAARFSGPRGLAIDGAGTLYLADEGNSNIRKITPSGLVTTLVGSAARLGKPRGLAVDPTGNVYIADTDNQTIRKVTPAGAVTTLAGADGIAGFADGPGAVARFRGPRAVAVASDGTVYVADTDNHAIRQISPTGRVTTRAAAAKP